MKAVILAAGRGSRMKDLTDETPKVLLPYKGITFLGFILTEMIDAGITEYYIIIGYMGYKVKAYVEGFLDPKKYKVTFIEQKFPLGTAHALSLLSYIDFPRNELLLITYGDVVVSTDDYRQIMQESMYGIHVGINHVDDPYQGGAVYFDQRNNITYIEEKPEKGTSDTQWNAAGVFYISVGALNTLLIKYDKDIHGLTKEWVFTEILARALNDKYEMKAIKMETWIHLQDEETYKELKSHAK